VLAIDIINPEISFVGLTPLNGTIITSNSFIINVSSNDTGDHYVITDFNKSLSLWVTMDYANASADPADLSVYSGNCSKKGNAAITASGKFGNGSVFDGAGDSFSCRNTANLNLSGTQGGSWGSWVKMATIGGFTERMVNRYRFGVTYGGYGSYSDESNRTFCGAWLGGTFNVVSVPIGTINNSAWHHVFCTYDGEKLKIYVDGANKANTSIVGTIQNYDSVVNIGAYYDGTTQSFNGSIDDVMIFRRALTPQEVSSLYNATATQYYQNFSNLTVGDYTFKSYAVDLAGNINSTDMRTVSVSTSLTSGTFNLIYWKITSSNVLQSNGTDWLFFNNTATSSQNVSLYNLTNALIYYNNYSIIGSSIISLNDGNINITLPAGNSTYILDNFNLTEGISRTNSPLWVSSKSDDGYTAVYHLASNLTTTLNNVSFYPSNVVCPISYSYTSNTSTYLNTIEVECASGYISRINVSGWEYSQSSNILTLNYYAHAIGGASPSGGASPTGLQITNDTTIANNVSVNNTSTVNMPIVKIDYLKLILFIVVGCVAITLLLFFISFVSNQFSK
jgi:hypothetical protein